MHCTFEYGSFSGKFFRLILFRECHIDLFFFVNVCSDQLIFKSRNKRSGSDRQRIIGSFSAFKSNSVDKTFKVKRDLIFILNRSVSYIDRSCIAFTLFVDLLIYFFLCNSCRNFINFQTFIFTEFYFRFYSHLCRKDKFFTFLKLCDLDLRLWHKLKLTLVICFRIRFWDHAVCRLIIEHFRSVHLFDHLTRNSSFTESRKTDLAALFQISCLKRFFHFLCRYFDR